MIIKGQRQRASTGATQAQVEPQIESHGELALHRGAARALWRGQAVGLTLSEYKVVTLLVSEGGSQTYRAIYDTAHFAGFIAGAGEHDTTNVRSIIKRNRRGGRSRIFSDQERATRRLSQARPLTALPARRPIVYQEKDRDRYDRIVAICRASGEDLGAILVRKAIAWAFTKFSVNYVDQQEEARIASRGVHEHDCLPSCEWRGQQRATSRPWNSLLAGEGFMQRRKDEHRGCLVTFSRILPQICCHYIGDLAPCHTLPCAHHIVSDFVALIHDHRVEKSGDVCGAHSLVQDKCLLRRLWSIALVV